MSTAEDFPVGTRVRFGTGGRGVVADPDNPLTLALDRTYRPEGLVYVWDDRTTPGKRGQYVYEYAVEDSIDAAASPPRFVDVHPGTWWRPEFLRVEES
jgi:hypothetical protein